LRRPHGFTLIEIMVVVVIIGIMITFAVLSVGSRSLDDRLGLEARRLQELFSLAADEAVLQGTELGFLQTDTGYEFVTLKDGKWIAVGEGPLRSRLVDEPMFMALLVEGRPAAPYKTVDSDKNEPKPQVVLLSSGETTEFALDIRARDFAPHYVIEGDVLGRVKMARKES
jgi:general secretion pathway protein H